MVAYPRTILAILILLLAIPTYNHYIGTPHFIHHKTDPPNYTIKYAPIVLQDGEKLENCIVMRKNHQSLNPFPHNFYYPLIMVHGKNIVIRNVKIYGNMLKNHCQSNDGSNIGILVDSSSHVVIKNVVIVNTQGDAINIHNSEFVDVKNVEAYAEEIYPYCALAVGGSRYVTVKNFKTFGFNHAVELYHPVDGVRQNYAIFFIDCMLFSHPQPSKHVGSVYVFEGRNVNFIRCQMNDRVLITGEQTFYRPTVDDVRFKNCVAPRVEVCYEGNVGEIVIYPPNSIEVVRWETHG